MSQKKKLITEIAKEAKQQTTFSALLGDTWCQLCCGDPKKETKNMEDEKEA